MLKKKKKNELSRNTNVFRACSAFLPVRSFVSARAVGESSFVALDLLFVSEDVLCTNIDDGTMCDHDPGRDGSFLARFQTTDSRDEAKV